MRWASLMARLLVQPDRGTGRIKASMLHGDPRKSRQDVAGSAVAARRMHFGIAARPSRRHGVPFRTTAGRRAAAPPHQLRWRLSAIA
jgi:hypothetical protein